jgi:hypothetical protein
MSDDASGVRLLRPVREVTRRAADARYRRGCRTIRDRISEKEDLEKLEALSGGDAGVIVKKNPGAVVIGESEFYGVLGPGIEESGAVVKCEGDESAVFVQGLGIDNSTVNGPDRTGNEKRVYRIVTDRFDVRINRAAGGSADLETRDFPPIC